MKNFDNYFLNENEDFTFKYVFKVRKDEYNDFYEKLLDKAEELDVLVKVTKGSGVSIINGLLSIKGERESVISLVDWIKENQ